MRAWTTSSLHLYYAERRRDPSDILAPDRPTTDHEWVDGQGWILPIDHIDRKAAREIENLPRFLFEINFNQENRLRVLEGKAEITRLQYRAALINLWKLLNP